MSETDCERVILTDIAIHSYEPRWYHVYSPVARSALALRQEGHVYSPVARGALALRQEGHVDI